VLPCHDVVCCVDTLCCAVCCCQVPDPMARYKQLLFYAAKLPPMSAEQHKPENKVEGCVSQVCVCGWVGHRQV
jgi:sulfur transfer protein SufE